MENNTAATQSIRVYSGAAHISDGAFIGEADPAISELTTWTTLDTPTLVLAPSASAMVTVTVTVPADAAEGERYAVIWAEIRGAANASGIVSASRAGIRIYLSVGPGNGAAADFAVDSLASARDARGNPTVASRVTNTGGRALDLTGSLSLSGGPAGLSVGPVNVLQAVTIAPGASQDVLMTLDSSLPNGPWTANLTLKSGLLERTAAATITFPDSGRGETVAPDSGIPIAWIVVITVITVLLVLALAAGTVWFLRRRRILRGTRAPELRK
ncbi:hypothetical protein E3O44_03060 [Cryobacterium algoricola]|uniref:DUF916 domain-containing protein n=1 Tax=Cryobacterium algoricola TaxID=1259183 RepID=A0ABY2IGA4_9MICO|nr:hypothetical protein [Cryobacterium algoricola]TFB90589.1 hypothetical protein E3O44_03060 [Cryobacterium algoricola]